MKKGARTMSSPSKSLVDYFKTKPVQECHKQQSNNNSLSRGGISNNKRRAIKLTKIPKEADLKKHKIHLVIAKSNVETLIVKSQGLVSVMKGLEAVSEWPGRMFLEKFLEGDTMKPWADKYAPKGIEELIEREPAEKVVKWLKTYASYKNMGGIVDEEDPFFFDNSTSMRDEEIRIVLSQERWRLKALVLLGREGVGKYSTVKCVSNSHHIKLHECTHWTNKLSYCKEFYESTKSHSLQQTEAKVNTNTKTSPNTNPKTGDKNTIKNYFKPQQIPSGICSKIHLIHQINQIYHQDKVVKFHESVIKFIDEAEVPVIITCSESEVPRLPQFLEYDVIEMKDLDSKRVAQFVWGVFHTEYNLSRFYRNELIKKEEVESILLRYFENVVWIELLTLEEMEVVVGKLEMRVDGILTFLQQYFLDNGCEYSITVEDIISAIPRYSKGECLFENRGVLGKREGVEMKEEVMSGEEMVGRINERVIDDLLDECQNRQELQQQQQGIDTEKQRFKPFGLWRRHGRIMDEICFKMSLRTGYQLSRREVECIRLFEPKERRLRSRKRLDSEVVPLERVLSKYFKKSDVCYILRTGVQ